MIAMDGERGKGSGRSIEGFDLLGGPPGMLRAPRRFGGPSCGRGAGDTSRAMLGFSEALGRHAEHHPQRERHDAGRAHRRARALRRARVWTWPRSCSGWRRSGAANPPVCLMVERGELQRPAADGRRQAPAVHGRVARRPRPRGQLRAGARVCRSRRASPRRRRSRSRSTSGMGISEPRLVLRHARPVAAPPSSRDGRASLHRRGGRGDRGRELVLFALPSRFNPAGTSPTL